MKKNLKEYILMILATVMWAGAFIAGKLGVGAFTPVMLTFLRLLIAFIVIFPYMVYRLPKQWQLEKHEVKTVFLLGFVGMTGYHILFFNALKYTTVSHASIINAFNPLITAIFAFFILRESLTLKHIFYILTAFLGVLLTISEWNLINIFNKGLNQGDLLMFFAATCWALYSIFVKQAIEKIPTLKLTTYTFMACAIILSPFAFNEIVFHDGLLVPAKAYIGIIYMALLPTVIGYTIQQHCIKHIGPSTTALFINLVPIFSIIMAVTFLKESFYPLNLVSMLMIIFSVYRFTQLKKNNGGNHENI